MRQASHRRLARTPALAALGLVLGLIGSSAFGGEPGAPGNGAENRAGDVRLWGRVVDEKGLPSRTSSATR